MKRAAKSCSMIYQFEYYLKTSTVIKIDKEYIQPIYQYSVLIYGSAKKKTDLKRLKAGKDSCGGTVVKLKKGKPELCLGQT